MGMGYNDVNSVCPFLIAKVYPAGRERTKETAGHPGLTQSGGSPPVKKEPQALLAA